MQKLFLTIFVSLGLTNAGLAQPPTPKTAPNPQDTGAVIRGSSAESTKKSNGSNKAASTNKSNTNTAGARTNASPLEDNEPIYAPYDPNPGVRVVPDSSGRLPPDYPPMMDRGGYGPNYGPSSGMSQYPEIDESGDDGMMMNPDGMPGYPNPNGSSGADFDFGGATFPPPNNVPNFPPPAPLPESDVNSRMPQDVPPASAPTPSNGVIMGVPPNGTAAPDAPPPSPTASPSPSTLFPEGSLFP